MPDNETAKTASGPKRRQLGLLVLGCLTVILVLIVTWFLVLRSRHDTLNLNGHSIALERVADDPARQKGLSGRDSLPKDRGMLFVFNRDQAGCFWMKDMRFPLDIVWLDMSKQVVQIAAHVSPLTYPRSFCPSDPATYVIELNAGQAKGLGIEVGHTLIF